MRDLIIFLAGTAFGMFAVVMLALARRDAHRQRRAERYGGYVSFTFTSHEGRDASAGTQVYELSGGGDVTPPPHLRVVQEGDGE